MIFSLRRWLGISVLNLLLVSLIGFVLRYKIVFSLPFVHQKDLLHAHSHFAFSGWVSQALLALLVYHLSTIQKQNLFPTFKVWLYLHLFSAYGMLISFPIQGYGAWSISFSTLSIFCIYGFSIQYWRMLNTAPEKLISRLWFRAALIFHVLSSLGTFVLAYLMANNIIHQNAYLASIYFFLHFQYNGWFLFSIIGLWVWWLETHLSTTTGLKSIFWLFAGSCPLAYFLSTLWLPLPLLIYGLVVISALMQTLGWFRLMKRSIQLPKNTLTILSKPAAWLMGIAAMACTLKIILQLASTIPVVSKWAFGYRPVVIAYLHLVLLGVISFFILGYCIQVAFKLNKMSLYGIIIFTIGFLLNEITLLAQGIAGIKNSFAPYMSETLLVAAGILALGMILVNLGFNAFSKKHYNETIIE